MCANLRKKWKKEKKKYEQVIKNLKKKKNLHRFSLFG